ncbi:MAG: hypothetical protein OEV44_11845 [Spirochaetota bacterium]|nr:hypothetical protein [Spirochaetota bacterium]
MVKYENRVIKSVRKNELAKDRFIVFDEIFKIIDETKKFDLFDVKLLKSSGTRNYYRLRKGKYRAIFYIEDDIIVVLIAKREEIYKLWESIQ